MPVRMVRSQWRIHERGVDRECMGDVILVRDHARRCEAHDVAARDEPEVVNRDAERIVATEVDGSAFRARLSHRGA